MNRDHSAGRLPEPVERYFREVTTMQPPADLMDGVVDEIAAMPQHHTNRFAFVPLIAAALAIGIIGAGLWAFGADGPIGQGLLPVPTSTPETAEPTPTAIPLATAPPIDTLPSGGTAVAGPEIAEVFPIRAASHGSLWLVNTDTDELVRYDADTGEEQARIGLDPGGAFTDIVDGVVAATDEWIFVVMPDRRIARVDPTTNEIVDRLQPEVHPWAMTIDGDDLWAIDSTADEVVRIDIATGEELARIGLEGGPRAAAAVDGRLWVSLADASTLVEIDPETNAVIGEYPISCCVTVIAAQGGSLYLSNDLAALSIDRFDLTERRVVARSSNLVWGFAHHGRVVGLDRNGLVAVLDPETFEWEAVVEIEPFQLSGIIAGEDAAMWVDISPDGRSRTLYRVTLGE